MAKADVRRFGKTCGGGVDAVVKQLESERKLSQSEERPGGGVVAGRERYEGFRQRCQQRQIRHFTEKIRI